MNRTEIAEEKKWREASHPRLVKRLDDQRTELSSINRLFLQITSERDNLRKRVEQLEAALKDMVDCYENDTNRPCVIHAQAVIAKAEGCAK